MQHVQTLLSASVFAFPRTYAPSPVWSGSSMGEVRFCPTPKKQAHALYRKLREWNRVRVAGRYGGALGSSCLRVAEALIFDFLNHRSGRLDPSYEAIAAKTGLGRSTVAEALKRLKALRIINWVRRCAAVQDEAGGFRLAQETNAYALCPASHWEGYREPPSLDLAKVEWGRAPVMPDTITQAVQDARTDGAVALIRGLETEPDDRLAAALARLGRSINGPLGH